MRIGSGLLRRAGGRGGQERLCSAIGARGYPVSAPDSEKLGKDGKFFGNHGAKLGKLVVFFGKLLMFFGKCPVFFGKHGEFAEKLFTIAQFCAVIAHFFLVVSVIFRLAKSSSSLPWKCGRIIFCPFKFTLDSSLLRVIMTPNERRFAWSEPQITQIRLISQIFRIATLSASA